MPGIDLDAYKRQLIERFSNAAGARHRRPAVRGELRPHPEVAAAGDPPQPRSTAGRSTGRPRSWPAWARYAEGVDEQGEPIEVVDRLAGHADGRPRRRSGEDPLAFVRNRELFGDLVDDERFAATYRRYLASLHEKGARATLEDLAGQ